ncbi:MAG: hypothetical protein ABIQ44_10795 [Chloroflexia bacterium]
MRLSSFPSHSIMANSTILYACTHTGLAIFNKPGTLPEWLPPRPALQGHEVTSAWGEPGPPIRVLAAVDGVLQLSENGGRTWEPASLSADAGSSPFMSIFYVADTHILHAVQYNGRLWKSADGGATWERLAALPEEGCVLSLEPAHDSPGDFYAMLGATDVTSLYKGNPDSGKWAALGDGLRDLDLIAIGQAPSAGFYALTSAGVMVTTEHDGSTDVDLQAGSPQNGQALVVIPGAASMPPALVVGTDQGIAVSPDGGATWHTPELPHTGSVTAFARDPERRDRLYAAIGNGFLVESGNRGMAWQAVNPQPPGPISYIYVVRI